MRAASAWRRPGDIAYGRRDAIGEAKSAYGMVARLALMQHVGPSSSARRAIIFLGFGGIVARRWRRHIAQIEKHAPAPSNRRGVKNRPAGVSCDGVRSLLLMRHLGLNRGLASSQSDKFLPCRRRAEPCRREIAATLGE